MEPTKCGFHPAHAQRLSMTLQDLSGKMPKTVKDQEELGSAGHRAVNQADPFSYQATHKKMVWLLRLTSACLIVSALANIGLSQIIFNMMPLKEVRVALIRADPDSDKIYSVEPITELVEGFALFLEKKSREYVKAILTIDSVGQNARFRQVKLYSDQRFFNQWLDRQSDTIEEAIKDGLNRSIIIETANRVDAYNNIYQYSVDFIRIDQIHDEEPVKRPLRAYLEVTTRPQNVSGPQALENPHGLVVLGMVVKERTAQ